MNYEDEINLLKYQIKLLKTVIGGDNHPFYMYLLDHDFTEEQHGLLMDILYVFNYRLMQKENQDSKIFFDSKKERLQLKLNELKLISKINVNELFSNTIPTYMEFESIILDVFSSTINPKYLLMSVQKEELCPSLCEHLLAQS